ncbi:hypothetical protein LINPERHAP2_LOCUS11538 [Linum perenne]
MRTRMADVWQPGRGIQIQDLGNRFVLFRFFHIICLTWVLENGSWAFNRYLILINKLIPGENPLTVSITSCPRRPD